ncbi:hypothetical protein TrCOL_g3646 [Triparma columacea]|uniref:Uncharacterized protein n=1 Tax=Triparma columacea TaxID=722753 RepID=A0A9W7GNV0_9STRA|nr:hypothetical protein TrCOL_g3646 [Triparma columacea]
MVLSDNPSCTHGAPVGIGWYYETAKVFRLQRYELGRIVGARIADGGGGEGIVRGLIEGHFNDGGGGNEGGNVGVTNETLELMPRRRERKMLRIPALRRRELCMIGGSSRREINEVIKKVKKAREERARSYRKFERDLGKYERKLGQAPTYVRPPPGP